MSTLSYLEESMVTMRTVLASVLSGSMRTPLEPSADSNDPIDFFASSASSVTSSLRAASSSEATIVVAWATALDLALVGPLEGGADGDDPMGARHLQLEVCIVGIAMNFT